MGVKPVNSVDTAAAFTEAVRGEMPRMQRLAQRLASGRADDVVQEALVRAWRFRSSYDPARGAFGSWLLAIVANETKRFRFPANVAEQPVATSERHLERRLDVQAAVRDLPVRQKLAVDCFYFAGLTVAETAAVMKCSEGTVKSTLSDARARLKKDKRLDDHAY